MDCEGTKQYKVQHKTSKRVGPTPITYYGLIFVLTTDAH